MAWIRGVAAVLGVAVVITVSFDPIAKHEPDAPFFYLFLEAALLLLFGAAVLRKASSLLRAVLLNLAVISFCLTAAEAYFAGWLPALSAGKTSASKSLWGEYFKGGYFIGDEVRGYGAQKGTKSRARVVQGGEVVYDIVYTINPDGLRVSPHDVGTAGSGRGIAPKSVVFFGCSVTVGEGVRDDETMPWLFESFSRGRYRSHNFGFHGYGPHQMLRILESSMLDAVMSDTPPRKAVYQGLVEHVERSAGNYPAVMWGPSAPRYVITDSGEISFKGPFCSPSKAELLRTLNRSHTFKAVAPVALGWQRTTQDMDLFVKIVRKSKEIFVERYHGEFAVLLWGPHRFSERHDADRRDYLYLLEHLRKEGIRVCEIDEILPDRSTSPEKYRLRGDEHPNPLAHELIARYLVEHL